VGLFFFHWSAKMAKPAAKITIPKGSANNPTPAAQFLVNPCYHFDCQGVTSGSPGPYVLMFEGNVETIPPMSRKWTLEASAGTITNDTEVSPVHAAPAQAGAGVLTLKAMDGQSDTGVNDTRTITIYKDHLDRDRDNFGVGISCTGPWKFTKYGIETTIGNTWNCHGSVKHAYDGSGIGDSSSPPNWQVKKTAEQGGDLGQLVRGDVIAYYDKNMAVMHSQTVLDANTTYAANNEPPASGNPPPETWKWAESAPGHWTDSISAEYKPVTIKVLARP
jgi:hypothetical protein